MRPNPLLKQVGQVDVVAHVERAEPGFLLRFGNAFVRERRAFLVEFHFVVLQILLADGFKGGQLGLERLKPFLHGGDITPIPHIADVALKTGDVDQTLLYPLVRSVPLGLH